MTVGSRPAAFPRAIPETSPVGSRARTGARRGRPSAPARPKNARAYTCARGEELPLDAVAALLESPLVEMPDDPLVVVTKRAVAVRERAATRAAMLAKGTIDGLQGHFLARPSPPGFVWAVIVESDGPRLFLHSRPETALEAA